MARFIVAYDGSDPSRAAFACALALAARTTEHGRSGWSVVLLHVIEPSPDVLLESPAVSLDPMMPPHMPMGLPTTLIEAERRERAWIEQEATGLRRECASRAVACEVRVEVGSLLDVLEDVPTPDDIIAVGATGRFRRGGVGSTTKSLVRNAPCPVLVTHAQSTAAAQITSIACAYDGAPPATDALAAARRLADATAFKLSVLAVARSGASALAPDYATLIAAAAPAAGPNADMIPLRPDPSLPITGEPELIASYMRGRTDTLLVMGAYANSWIHDLLIGSVTAQVLSAITAPILLVHDRHARGTPITAD